MAGVLRALKNSLGEQVSRHRNRPFFEAAMAAAALVTQADGKVTISERHRLDQIIEQLDQLNIFDVHEAADLMNDNLDAIRRHPQEAHPRLLKDVARIANDSEAARLLVRICLAISIADDEYHPDEKSRVGDICGALGLDPAEFET